MPTVHSESSETIVDILKSASSPAPDSRLTEVLEAFRRQWLAIARKKYASLGPDIEDTIQGALLKLISPARLASLRDTARVEAWARSLFVNAVLDLIRERRRDLGRRSIGRPEDDPEEVLCDRLPSAAPTPEELAAQLPAAREDRRALLAQAATDESTALTIPARPEEEALSFAFARDPFRLASAHAAERASIGIAEQ